MRTPATGVKQFLGMLIEGYGGALTDTQKKFAETAYESNERQLNIVNDLLKVAQVDAGKVILTKEKVDLEALVQDVLEEQKTKFTERQQQVTYNNTTKSIMAFVDVRHFRMAIDNIIDNASKYTEPGKNVSVTLSREGGSAIISIEDQGVGIASDDIERIFTKFTRVDNPLSVSVGGSGIGLYWCKKIVELHNGSISVTSVIGKGTTFIIAIPLK